MTETLSCKSDKTAAVNYQHGKGSINYNYIDTFSTNSEERKRQIYNGMHSQEMNATYNSKFQKQTNSIKHQDNVLLVDSNANNELVNTQAMNLAPWPTGICWIPSTKSWSVASNNGVKEIRLFSVEKYNGVEAAYAHALANYNSNLSNRNSLETNRGNETMYSKGSGATSNNFTNSEGRKKESIGEFIRSNHSESNDNDENYDPHNYIKHYSSGMQQTNIGNQSSQLESDLAIPPQNPGNYKKFRNPLTVTRSPATIPACKLIADASELPLVQGVRWSSKYLRFEVQHSNSTTSFSAKTSGVKPAFDKALNWLQHKKDDSKFGENSIKRKAGNYDNSSMRERKRRQSVNVVYSEQEYSNEEGTNVPNSSNALPRRKRKHKFDQLVIDDDQIYNTNESNQIKVNHGEDSKNPNYNSFKHLRSSDYNNAETAFEGKLDTVDGNNQCRLHLQKLSVLICIDDLASRCYPTMNREEKGVISSSGDSNFIIGMHCKRVRAALNSQSLLPYLELFSLPIKRNELPSMLSRDAQLVMLSGLRTVYCILSSVEASNTVT